MGSSIYDNGGVIGQNKNILDLNQYVVDYTPTSILLPIQYVGISNTTGSSTIGTLTLSMPAGIVNNDVAILNIGVGCVTNKTFVVNTYTQINDLYNSDTYDVSLYMGYRVLNGTETNVSFTVNSGNTADAYRASVIVFRNIDTSVVLDVAAVSNTNFNTGSPPLASITSVSNGCVIVQTAGTGHNLSTGINYSSSYGFTFQEQGTSNSTNDILLGIGYGNSNPGGNATSIGFTAVSTNSASFSYATSTISLRPATGSINVPVYGVAKRSGMWNLRSTPGTIQSFDGSSLAGWTANGVTVANTGGNPGAAFRSLGGSYAYYDTGKSLVGKQISFDIYVPSGNTYQLANFYVAGNTSGGGIMFRIEGRSYNSSGFFRVSDYSPGTQENPGLPHHTTNTWYHVDINVFANKMDAFVDGVLFDTIVNYPYQSNNITIYGDVTGSSGAFFDNIKVIG